MAIENDVPLPHGRILRNFSVSFVSTSGDSGSYRTVPAGKVWEVISLRSTMTEPTPVGMDFIITDGATDLAILTNGPDRADASDLGWQGSLMVPGGFRIYARFFGMVGGYSDNNWQYIAIEHKGLAV